MQSAPDKANTDDSESLFDFLNVDEDNPGSDATGRNGSDGVRRKKSESTSRSPRAGNEDKPFPVIRKPVCVTQTGALRAPKPGDPVEPPPPLTDGVRVAPAPVNRPERAEVDFSDLDDLNLDFDKDDWPASDQWVDKSPHVRFDNVDENKTGFIRKTGYGLAGLLIVAGGLVALYTVPSVKSWTDNTIAGFTGGQNEQATLAVEGEVQGNAIATDFAAAPNTLNTRFREELANLEVMLEQGGLDEAQARLDTMDRAVYGYGAPEFTEIKERIALLRQGGVPETADAQLIEQQRVEQARALEEQRALAEAQRQADAEQAAAQARAAEEQRLAAEEQRAAAQAAEEQRLAAAAQEQRLVAEAEAAKAALAEQERLAAEAALVAQQRAEEEQTLALERQAEQERLAQAAEAEQLALANAAREKELAQQAQVRADRIAQERARQEQLALAREERRLADLAQQQPVDQSAASEAGQSADWQALNPQQPAESIQDIAASQREAARQQRLIDARERAAAQAGTVEPVEQNSPETVVALAEPVPVQPIEPEPRSITDADLQIVYGQFARLQSAIEDRDVNAVIRLTERSGVRIQQVMQMFENNVSIQTRLRNVSTLDVSGEIQGTLQITRLVRADGSVTGPPLNLGSVRLSSIRKGDGWSAIRW